MIKNLTLLLNQARDGTAAREAALPLVYAELRAIAAVHIRREKPGHSLLPTDLVHEAYLRLFDGETPSWNNRKHFFATAALAMRHILVDHARKKCSLKRSDPEAGLRRSERLAFGSRLSPEDILDLDCALSELQQLDERQYQIVQLRFFAGLNGRETAELMGISQSTVARQWWSAKLWLREQMAHE